MNPFLREHAAPLLGSTLLHLLVAAAALVATWYAVAPKFVVPAAIEAYIAAPPAARAQPAPAPAPALPAPAAEPVAPPEPVAAKPEPKPDPALAAAKAAEESAVAARREETLRLQQEAALRAAAARDKARADDTRRKSEAEARRRADAEAARQRLQVEEAKRAAAAAAAASAAEKRRNDAEAKLKAARESDLARELAAEEQRTGAVNAGLEARYVAQIRAAVERAWHRPPTARTGLRCMVYVSQVPGGTVTNVKIGTCNGDAAVQQSITNAVHDASPLPAPPDPSLFQRNLNLEFAPND